MQSPLEQGGFMNKKGVLFRNSKTVLKTNSLEFQEKHVVIRRRNAVGPLKRQP